MIRFSAMKKILKTKIKKPFSNLSMKESMLTMELGTIKQRKINYLSLSWCIIIWRLILDSKQQPRTLTWE